jgi:hypothetical protein
MRCCSARSPSVRTWGMHTTYMHSCTGLQPRVHGVAASSARGCSLECTGLQPRVHGVAASSARGRRSRLDEVGGRGEGQRWGAEVGGRGGGAEVGGCGAAVCVGAHHLAQAGGEHAGLARTHGADDQAELTARQLEREVTEHRGAGGPLEARPAQDHSRRLRPPGVTGRRRELVCLQEAVEAAGGELG